MKAFIRGVWQSEFIRNSTKLLSANALSQVVAVLLLPFVTRIYSEHDMGVLGLFLSVGGFLALFAGAKYEFAILLEKDHESAAAVFDLSFLLIFSFSLLITFILLVAGDWILEGIGYDCLIPYSMMIPLFVFLSALGLTLTYWFNYNKQFTRTAIYNLEQVASNNILKLGLGLCASGPTSLIAANQISYVLALLLSFIRKRNSAGLFRFSYPNMKRVAREHQKFPKYYLPHTIVNYFSANLAILMLSGNFDMKVIGIFSIAMMLGFRPIALISDSLEQVLSQNLAVRVNQRESILKSVYKLSFRIFVFSLPGFVILYFVLPWIIDFYLGDKWSEVAFYIRLLLPFFLLTLLCSPLSSIPSIVGSQGKALIVEVIRLAVRVLALLIGIWLDSFVLAIALFSIASTLMWGVQYFWYLFLIKKYERMINQE